MRRAVKGPYEPDGTRLPVNVQQPPTSSTRQPELVKGTAVPQFRFEHDVSILHTPKKPPNPTSQLSTLVVELLQDNWLVRVDAQFERPCHLLVEERWDYEEWEGFLASVLLDLKVLFQDDIECNLRSFAGSSR